MYEIIVSGLMHYPQHLEVESYHQAQQLVKEIESEFPLRQVELVEVSDELDEMVNCLSTN